MLRRHYASVVEGDCVMVAGFRCTGHERTVFDIAGTATPELLLGCADASVRRAVFANEAGRDGHWRPTGSANERTAAWRARMRARAEAAPRRHGNQAFRWVAEFADPRADSVLESVSRLRFAQLGIEVETQVHVPIPGQAGYDVDFHLVGLGIFGEADGDSKYTDPALLGTRSPAEAVLREKKRDNLISGVSGNRMIHWGATHASTVERFAGMLTTFGVPIPRRARPRRKVA